MQLPKITQQIREFTHTRTSTYKIIWAQMRWKATDYRGAAQAVCGC